MNGAGRLLVPLGAAAAAAYFLAHVQHLLPPFLLAGAIAYLLNPLVNFFRMRGVRRDAAIVVVFTAALLIAAGASYAVLRSAAENSPRISRQLPQHISRAQGMLQGALEDAGALDLARSSGALDWLGGGDEEEPWYAGLLHALPNPATHVLQFLEFALLVPFLTYFFMLDGALWRDKLLELAPAGQVEMILNVLVETDRSFRNYLRGLLLQAVFMGGAAGLGFWLMGLRYSGLIALWVALTSMIPFVGPTSAAVAGSVVAFLQWGTLAGMLKVSIVYLVIRLLDDWFFHPYVLRRAVHIHPVITVFSLMAGGSLYGFWGLLFAIPAVCIVQVLLEVTWRYYRSAYGLSFQDVPFDTGIPVI